MKKTHILFSIVFAVALLLAASEVRAQLATPWPPARQCTTSLGTAVAGPCIDGIPIPGCPNQSGLAPNFPRLVNCSADSAECNGATYPCPVAPCPPLTGQFLRWDFGFTGLGSPSLVGTQVAADVQIEAALETTVISAPGLGSSSLGGVGTYDWDSRWIKFPGNSAGQTTYFTSYFTKTGIAAASEGVIFKSGKSTAICGLAGAGTPSRQLDPNQPIPTSSSFETPGCLVTYNVTPFNDVVWGSVTVTNKPNETCTLTESDQPLKIAGPTQDEPILYMGGPITWSGSCSYCVANCSNTTGGATYVTCTSCCVVIDPVTQKRKCVLKSSLSNPATQCMAGTYP